MAFDRLKMPIGDAMFTQRSVRRFKPDPIPIEDIHLIIDAAVKAPNGGNRQIGRFLVLTDRNVIREFGTIYHEAWWAKRKEERGWTKRADIPPEEKNYKLASELADEMKDVPCVVFACAVPPGTANSVIPATQNLMLAAHSLGIGLGAHHAPPDRDGSLPRDVRDSQGRGLPLLHPARLPAYGLRIEPAATDLGDHVPQPLGRAGTLDMTRVLVYRSRPCHLQI